MGRHSAPDDVDDDAAGAGGNSGAGSAAGAAASGAAPAGTGVAVVDDLDAILRGRHAAARTPPSHPPIGPPVQSVRPVQAVPAAESVSPVQAVPAADSVSPVELAAGSAPPRATERQHTAADLALLKAHGDLRSWCAGAVLVSLLVYVVVLAAVDGDVTPRSFLIWLWIPLVTIGLLVGLILDLGHKKYPAG